MVFRFTWKKQRPFLDLKSKDGVAFLDFSDHSFRPTTTDWFGRWRPAAAAENDWMIDRNAQRSGASFTGIRNLFVQDQAVVESPGALVDHTLEHLGPTDRMITQTRRRLLKAVNAHGKLGALPPGVNDPGVFLGARSGQVTAPIELGWEQAYETALAVAQRPGVAFSQAAE